MKIIFLNTWKGEREKELGDFLREESKDTDVFCFQEFFHRTPALCKELLKGFAEIYLHKRINDVQNFDQVIYVREGISIIETGSLFLESKDCGFATWISINQSGEKFYVCNYHGMAEPGHKRDTESRITASRLIIDFFKNKKGSKIIGGDFNLLPETESIHMFTPYGYRNLIEEYDVKTTRNRIAWDRYPNNKQYYADYVFVSSEVLVKSFEVPQNEVSDHLPLILKIE